jgi:hypothetical protein
MKKSNTSKKQLIKELAVQFEEDFKKTLPFDLQSDGSIIYNNFIVKKNTKGNWGIYKNNYLIEEYYLKTCALLAAKAYSKTNLNRFFEIKHLDSKYWASVSDLRVYKKNIKKAAEFDRFIILLNKLEDSEYKTDIYKNEISKMFKCNFV